MDQPALGHHARGPALGAGADAELPEVRAGRAARLACRNRWTLISCVSIGCMSSPDIELQHWQHLSGEEQAQLMALRIAAGQAEYAGSMQRAMVKLQAQQG